MKTGNRKKFSKDWFPKKSKKKIKICYTYKA